MSDLMVGSSSNVRSGAYFIVRSIGECRCCRASTPVIALALGPEHETLSTDADDERGDSIPDIWETAACNALLFYVETLPDSVQRRLADFSQTYRYACSAETHGSSWANHCLPGGDPPTFHAHLLATTREVTTTGLAAKTTLELSDSHLRKLGLEPVINEL